MPAPGGEGAWSREEESALVPGGCLVWQCVCFGWVPGGDSWSGSAVGGTSCYWGGPLAPRGNGHPCRHMQLRHDPPAVFIFDFRQVQKLHGPSQTLTF